MAGKRKQFPDTVATTVILPRGVKTLLAELAHEHGVSLSTYLRLLIYQHLKERVGEDRFNSAVYGIPLSN